MLINFRIYVIYVMYKWFCIVYLLFMNLFIMFIYFYIYVSGMFYDLFWYFKIKDNYVIWNFCYLIKVVVLKELMIKDWMNERKKIM